MVTITASAGAGGSIDPNGEVVIESGADQLFTFTPDSGYEVDEVLVGGSAVTPDNDTYEMTNVTTDTTIAVSFKQTPVVKYTITATAGAGGSITPSGAVEVVEGENQKFTFAPDNGYKVGDVLVNEVSIEAKESYTFVGVEEDGTIEVRFVKLPNVANAKVVHDVFGSSRVDVIHFSGKYPIGGVPVGIRDGILFFNKNHWGYTHMGTVVIIGYEGELENGTELEGLSALVIYR